MRRLYVEKSKDDGKYHFFEIKFQGEDLNSTCVVHVDGPFDTEDEAEKKKQEILKRPTTPVNRVKLSDVSEG